MNPHKKQSIQKLLIQQSGSETLDLNDIVLGYQGSRIVGSLIPQYHKNIRHVKLNGNNIDGQGFQFIFSGLMHCGYLKSIHAEWNNIGSSDVGLAALCGLVANSHYLEFIDLKNNRISHHLAGFIAEILEMNKKNLKVIDLRWNDLGELGAKQILATLAINKNVKFIGLEDNRISMGTLMQIESMLKGGGIHIGRQQPRLLKHSHSQPNTFAQQYFPISSDNYASMDTQLRTGELRSKIQNEQKQANRYSEKVQVEIQKVLQKIKLKGAQISEMQLRHDGLMADNGKITSQLREAERMLALEKQRALGIQTKYSDEKTQIKNQKYKLNNNIQNVMQKYTQRNQRELEQIDLVMGQKLDRLNAYLKQRLFQKRANRQKLSQLKQDIFKLKLSRQQIPNRQISAKTIHSQKSAYDEQIFIIKQQIANVESTLQNQIKKGQYMSKELNNQVVKALAREQNLEKEIFNVQNKIKGIHHGMAIKNLELERNLAQLRLKESEIFDKQATLDMENQYLKYMHSEGSVKFQVQALIQQQLVKGCQKSQQGIESRITQVQRALRSQQAQNRMIKNQYEKLMSQLQNITKKNIQLVLFE